MTNNISQKKTDYETLLYIKENIEQMSKKHQINILKIFTNYKSEILNENNNGIFINLSKLDKKILEELSKFIKYVNTQEEQLNNIEQQKDNLENKFFKADKDINSIYLNE